MPASTPAAARDGAATPSSTAVRDEDRVDVAIVGGGPCGLAVAVGLSRAAPSLKVAVLERADALRPVGFTIGLLGKDRGERRSTHARGRVFLARTRPHPSPSTHPGNGLNALHALDPSLGATIEDGLLPDGPFVQFSAEDPSVINFAAPSAAGIWAGLSRATGHFPWFRIVEECAGRLPPGVLRLDHSLTSFEEDGEGVTVHTRSRGPSGAPNPPVRASLLIGADGNQSGVRSELLGDGPPAYSGLSVWRGQCDTPEDWPADFEKPLLLGWGKGKFIMLVVKLGGGRLAWQCFAPWPEARLGELASTRVTDAAATARADTAKRDRCLEAHVGFPERALGLIRSTPPELITEHPQGFREPDACTVWGAGRVSLAGDAAHLATPFLGQGTGQALEDAVELARAIATHGPTAEALRAYEAVRIPLASVVQAGSVELAKAVAAGGRAGERDWYAAHPEVLGREPAPLVGVADKVE